MNKIKVHLRFDENIGLHSKVTIFMRGANCGQLTLRAEEAIWLHHIFEKGCEFLKFDFVSSGKSPDADPNLIDQCAVELRID